MESRRFTLSVHDPDSDDPARRRLLAALAAALAAPAEVGTEAIDEGKAIAKLQQLVGRASLRLRTAVADGAEPATRTVQRLREVIDAADPLALAAERYPEPSLLAEDVLFCRRLLTDMDTALELSAMRDYLQSAVIPDSAGNLAIDRRVTLEQMPSVALFNEPFLMDQMRATFEFYRHRYIAAYQEHHRAYWAACARLSREIDEAEPTARALDWLNSLRELGKAIGINALAQYSDLRRSLDGCSLQGALSDSLRSVTACPTCSVTLADEPPSTEVHEVTVRLRRALRQQQNRLSSAAIRRILSQGKGERVEQFLQVVQASDLHALAELLDEELVDFLRELLSSPQAPASELLERFSHECPEITEESLDDAVGMFRRLLREALASAQTADPLHKPRIVLGRKTARRAMPTDGQAQRQT